MLKRLYKFQNQDSFNNSEESLNELPHFTSLKVDEEEVDYKNYKINPEDYIKPTSASVAADICIVDNGGNKYIVDGATYSTDIYPAEQYTPIGVVVVPASHTDDGTARVISLAAMDYNNPNNGNTSGHANIYWGGYGYDIPNLNYKTMYPAIAEDLRSISGEQQITNWYYLNDTNGYLPSDYYTIYPNPYDEGTYYKKGLGVQSSVNAIPSPYLTGGAKNDIYHSTANTSNMYADMDGKSNTEKILSMDNGGSTAWQTATTITNNNNVETNHPAAQCCWRFHTTGTTQGDWYLPAGGELGYLAARWKAINASISKVASFEFSGLSLPAGYYWWWSSTDYSSDRAVGLHFYSSYAYLSYGNKLNASFCVRAFLKVS